MTVDLSVARSSLRLISSIQLNLEHSEHEPLRGPKWVSQQLPTYSFSLKSRDETKVPDFFLVDPSQRPSALASSTPQRATPTWSDGRANGHQKQKQTEEKCGE
jgi:hypothetical protein